MNKLLDLILIPLNKLMTSPGLQAAIKASPLIIIPVLVYLWGVQYLKTQEATKRWELELKKEALMIDNNPRLSEALSYYLIDGKIDDGYMMDYLSLLETESLADTVEIGVTQHIQAKRAIGMIRQVFSDQYSADMAATYLHDHAYQLDSATLAIFIKESEKYEEVGLDRLTEFFIQMSESVAGKKCIMENERLITNFLTYKKVRKSKIKKILSNPSN